MNVDPFSSSKRRISRAKSHINELKGKADQFLKDNPCSRVIERDSDGIHEVHKIKFSAIPDIIEDIAIDALSSLRPALDHAAYVIAIATGTHTTKSAYFPISNSETELENVIARNCKDIPVEIVSLFRTFKPYAGGNDLIWALNRANNSNKHRLLVPFFQFPRDMNLRVRGTGGSGVHIPPLIYDRAKNEIVFAVIATDTQLEYNLNGTYCIAFDGIAPIEGYSVTDVLNAMVREVERIVMATETEARRIGLVQ
ncbi:hypothetical protein [Candidatus Nitrotoga sp. 1052]|uniref:hypothetical protein n=1 Tax=Candidatus Nitrotoga sp. 1052 TaxID=2886964 RepID=UPI001EF74419|nr:hypothetical protein [Candidatus Nitrotoga sp. 1052]CAH1077743.1 conserved hypothetical protein [Candidatus Nitrotoga sp. 1052]